MLKLNDRPYWWTLMFALCLLVSGCSFFKKDVIRVPHYQELQVIHPEPPIPLQLRNPPIRVLTSKQVIEDASKNPQDTYYVLSQDALDDLLSDDIDKLEYAQHESRRAEYYKDLIESFNKKVRERNNKAFEEAR